MSSTTDNIKTGTNIAVLPEDLNVGKDILITPEMNLEAPQISVQKSIISTIHNRQDNSILKQAFINVII